MSKTIQITIKPLDYYFFGTNETFEFGAKGVKNFSVKSNPLPQQTGLIGLLRHAFLCAGYDIGSSFIPGVSEQDFGLIQSITPLYLLNDKDEILYKCPLPVQETKEGITTPISFKVSDTAAIYNNGKVRQTFAANKYNPKQELANKWLNINTGKQENDSQLFSSEIHIGIDKGKTNNRETDEGAFYKQQFYRLTNAAIAFQAAVDDQVDVNNLPGLLPFGGEKRMFGISYADGEFTGWNRIQAEVTSKFNEYLPESEPCIMLLTDTYVSDLRELEVAVSYAVLQAKPFRSIITPKSVTNFSRLGSIAGDDKQLYKPAVTTYILKQGSVLFIDENKKGIILEMINHPGFAKIGYNQFIKNF